MLSKELVRLQEIALGQFAAIIGPTTWLTSSGQQSKYAAVRADKVIRNIDGLNFLKLMDMTA